MPAWVLYRKGEQAFREQRLGEALMLYRQALATRNPYPEAEAGIGAVLQAEGNLRPAERQYLRAIDQRAFFTVPQEEFAVRYRLAEIYRQLRNRRSYEQMLLSITMTEELFAEDGDALLREAMRQTLLGSGFDRMAALYRIDSPETLDAHAQLGEHFVLSGNYFTALQHSIVANLKIVTTLVRYVRTVEPDYRYDNLQSLLERVTEDEELRQFAFERTDFYRYLYYLAAAVYGQSPISDTWRSIWQILARRPDAGRWSLLASERLRRPQLEPLVGF